MAVAVFIKSESGDNYLNVWDILDLEAIESWVLGNTDQFCEYEVAATDREDLPLVEKVVNYCMESFNLGEE